MQRENEFLTRSFPRLRQFNAAKDKIQKNETRPPDRKLTSHFRVRQKDLVRKKNLPVKKKENGNDPSAKQSSLHGVCHSCGIAERDTQKTLE